MRHAQPTLRPVTLLLVCLASIGGCAELDQHNRGTWLGQPVRARNQPAEALAAKAAFWYPLRDLVTLEPMGRLLFGDRAWNVNDTGGVDDSSFYTNRPTAEPSPEPSAASLWSVPPPQPPWSIVKVKAAGATDGFVGRDAGGRTFLVKLDHPDYPELGSSAEVIGARLMWLLGYHVAPSFVVTVSGTGDPRFDGRRASASLYIEGQVLGHFAFDWFRYRREFRAARLACAWINDTDRAANNGLVVLRQERAFYYLIDFNSSLGSWNGQPKEPWQGRRYRGDVLWSWWRGLFPQSSDDGYAPNQRIMSPAAGRFDAHFDPRTWQPNLPNTAFDHLTDDDARWMARKLAAIAEAQIRAAVEAARFSDPADQDHVLSTLLQRRRRILDSYGA